MKNDLLKTYEKIAALHIVYCSELRFGQFLLDFNIWHIHKYGRDIYYLSSEDIIQRVTEYVTTFKTDSMKELYS